METFDAIRTILAVRHFKDTPIPEPIVQHIVEAGRLTASGGNSQPWHFIVVRDKETLRQLGQLARTGPYIAQAPLAIVVAMDRNPLAVSDGSRAIQNMMVQNTPNNTVIYPANVASLQRAWTYRTGDAIESSPMVVSEVVYIGSRDHHLYALDARTGKKLWSYMTGGAIYATPTVVDDVVYAGSFDTTLSALEARTGTLLWRYDTGNAI